VNPRCFRQRKHDQRLVVVIVATANIYAALATSMINRLPSTAKAASKSSSRDRRRTSRRRSTRSGVQPSRRDNDCGVIRQARIASYTESLAAARGATVATRWPLAGFDGRGMGSRSSIRAANITSNALDALQRFVPIGPYGHRARHIESQRQNGAVLIPVKRDRVSVSHGSFLS
jgi:hypothetical protein